MGEDRFKLATVRERNYIVKELRDRSIVEYDGLLKNLHPTLTFFVECKIETNSTSYKYLLVEIPPLSEKMVMSHNSGPVLENEIDFEILKVYIHKSND
ncbi:MAG: hypothetical protein SFU98_16195 [Leptospiraceae bacterium]|nr:hypothetical protein [Leptospiraceae bacterium]